MQWRYINIDACTRTSLFGGEFVNQDNDPQSMDEFWANVEVVEIMNGKLQSQQIKLKVQPLHQDKSSSS